MDLEVRPGMYVLSVDGQKMGRIASIEGDGFDVVRGHRNPEGLTVGADDLCSRLQSTVFLRLPLHRYEAKYGPRKAPAPRTVKRGDRRFLLFRKAEVKW